MLKQQLVHATAGTRMERLATVVATVEVHPVAPMEPPVQVAAVRALPWAAAMAQHTI